MPYVHKSVNYGLGRSPLYQYSHINLSLLGHNKDRDKFSLIQIF